MELSGEPVAPGDEVWILGPEGDWDLTSGRVASVDDGVVLLEADSRDGMSGSPICPQGDQGTLFAIHVSGLPPDRTTKAVTIRDTVRSALYDLNG